MIDLLSHPSQLLPKHTDTCSHKHLDPTFKGSPLAFKLCVSIAWVFSHRQQNRECPSHWVCVGKFIEGDSTISLSPTL